MKEIMPSLRSMLRWAESSRAIAEALPDMLREFWERMRPRKTYRVWYSTGAVVLVDAESESDARRRAEEQASEDGFPDLRVVCVEVLSRGEE
jgi:hypothetical protein